MSHHSHAFTAEQRQWQPTTQVETSQHYLNPVPPPYTELYNNHRSNPPRDVHDSHSIRASGYSGPKPSHQSETRTSHGNTGWQEQSVQPYSAPSHPQFQGNSQFIMSPDTLQSTTLPPSLAPQRPVSPSTENADAILLSKTLAFINKLPPAPSQPLRLLRPILIPQLPPARGLGSPFMRVWAPCLTFSNLTVDGCLALVDNLNIISSASPPLQILDLAGGVLGMVPYHWATLAGAGIQASAKVGTRVVSKQRTQTFLNEVNTRVFTPRRMRMRLVSGEEIPRVLRMTEAQATLDDGWDDDLLEKVLKNVQPFTAPLSRQDLPVAEGQTGFLDKWSAKAVEREKAKIAKKGMKQQEKQKDKRDKGLRKAERKQSKEARKQEKRARKHGDHTRHERSSESSSSDSEDARYMNRNGDLVKTGKPREKEIKQAKKLLWILIESL